MTETEIDCRCCKNQPICKIYEETRKFNDAISERFSSGAFSSGDWVNVSLLVMPNVCGYFSKRGP